MLTLPGQVVELRIAFEEWHARLPDHRLDGQVGSHAGTVVGATSPRLRGDGA